MFLFELSGAFEALANALWLSRLSEHHPRQVLLKRYSRGELFRIGTDCEQVSIELFQHPDLLRVITKEIVRAKLAARHSTPLHWLRPRKPTRKIAETTVMISRAGWA